MSGLAVEASDLLFSYLTSAPVLRGVTLAVPSGSFLGIVGPNGAGKSTLLQLLTGALQPGQGRVSLFDRLLPRWKRRDIARRVGVVPQSETGAFSFRVKDIVLMGRTPYLKGVLSIESSRDHAAADAALEAVGIAHLAGRSVDQLSGGEKQMALVARALAQEPDLLLLDEPTASLDLAHQQSVFRLLSRLNSERGLTIIVVTHDLNLAALYCRSLAVLNDGLILAQGAPDDIMRSEFLSGLYGADLWSSRSPAGAPIVGLKP